jgi:hypothetical protein
MVARARWRAAVAGGGGAVAWFQGRRRGRGSGSIWATWARNLLGRLGLKANWVRVSGGGGFGGVHFRKEGHGFLGKMQMSCGSFGPGRKKERPHWLLSCCASKAEWLLGWLRVGKLNENSWAG